jgi:hypothetical protein
MIGRVGPRGTATTPWQLSERTSDVRLRKSGRALVSALLPSRKLACTLATTPSFHSPFPTHQHPPQPQPLAISTLHTRHPSTRSANSTRLSLCTHVLSRARLVISPPLQNVVRRRVHGRPPPPHLARNAPPALCRRQRPRLAAL